MGWKNKKTKNKKTAHVARPGALQDKPEVGDVESPIKLAPSPALPRQRVSYRSHHVGQGLAIQQGWLRPGWRRGVDFVLQLQRARDG